MGFDFFSRGDSQTKGCLSCLIWDLKVDTDPKGGLCPLNLLPIMTKFCVYSTREQLDKGIFFEGLQNYMENKNRGNENKIILEDLNCTMDKMDRDGENETQRLCWCCFSYALSKLIVIMGLSIFGEGRIQILLSSCATISPLARIQDRQGLYWYKDC